MKQRELENQGRGRGRVDAFQKSIFRVQCWLIPIPEPEVEAANSRREANSLCCDTPEKLPLQNPCQSLRPRRTLRLPEMVAILDTEVPHPIHPESYNSKQPAIFCQITPMSEFPRRLGISLSLEWLLQ